MYRQPTDMSRDAGYQSVTGTAQPEAAARDDDDNDVKDADDEQNDNDEGNSRTSEKFCVLRKWRTR